MACLFSLQQIATMDVLRMCFESFITHIYKNNRRDDKFLIAASLSDPKMFSYCFDGNRTEKLFDG
jgi:hypothetical protein